MIVNPDNFLLRKIVESINSYALNIINQTINTENCIKLLGIGIDNTLTFDQ